MRDATLRDLTARTMLSLKDFEGEPNTPATRDRIKRRLTDLVRGTPMFTIARLQQLFEGWASDGMAELHLTSSKAPKVDLWEQYESYAVLALIRVPVHQKRDWMALKDYINDRLNRCRDESQIPAGINMRIAVIPFGKRGDAMESRIRLGGYGV